MCVLQQSNPAFFRHFESYLDLVFIHQDSKAAFNITRESECELNYPPRRERLHSQPPAACSLRCTADCLCECTLRPGWPPFQTFRIFKGPFAWNRRTPNIANCLAEILPCLPRIWTKRSQTIEARFI